MAFPDYSGRSHRVTPCGPFEIFTGHSVPSNQLGRGYIFIKCTAKGVVKVLSDNIIHPFGLVENVDSDNGSHFTASIVKELTRH
jgi:hypothetical protein